MTVALIVRLARKPARQNQMIDSGSVVSISRCAKNWARPRLDLRSLANIIMPPAIDIVMTARPSAALNRHQVFQANEICWRAMTRHRVEAARRVPM